MDVSVILEKLINKEIEVNRSRYALGHQMISSAVNYFNEGVKQSIVDKHATKYNAPVQLSACFDEVALWKLERTSDDMYYTGLLRDPKIDEDLNEYLAKYYKYLQPAIRFGVGVEVF